MVGSLHMRADIHSRYGGNPRAGICPTRSGVVLIFSDPDSGRPFGYNSHDYLQDGVYHYTGEGRVGDQQLIRGNRALVDSSKTLLLFSRVDLKTWRFVGEVSLADPAFNVAQAPDQLGQARQVLVFRFKEKNADFGLLGTSCLD